MKAAVVHAAVVASNFEEVRLLGRNERSLKLFGSFISNVSMKKHLLRGLSLFEFKTPIYVMQKRSYQWTVELEIIVCFVLMKMMRWN